MGCSCPHLQRRKVKLQRAKAGTKAPDMSARSLRMDQEVSEVCLNGLTHRQTTEERGGEGSGEEVRLISAGLAGFLVDQS